MTKMKLTPVIKRDKNWFIAWIKEIPGVNTQGRTLQEVKENLKDALEMMREEKKVSRIHA
ncbi:MAG: type II toxin-antitoxin system HicB family antitoxin [Candidatus Paceibacterota bacterium]